MNRLLIPTLAAAAVTLLSGCQTVTVRRGTVCDRGAKHGVQAAAPCSATVQRVARNLQA
jgi:hypothetical protein